MIRSAFPAAPVRVRPALLVAALGLLALPLTARAQARTMTVRFDETPLVDVLSTFANVAEVSLVAGPGVTGTVTAEIKDQPWDVALQAILAAQGLRAVETPSGILLVEPLDGLAGRERVEPLLTRVIRVNFLTAQELLGVVQGLLTERGTAGVVPGANALVVTDVPRVVAQVERLIRGVPGG